MKPTFKLYQQNNQDNLRFGSKLVLNVTVIGKLNFWTPQGDGMANYEFLFNEICVLH